MTIKLQSGWHTEMPGFRIADPYADPNTDTTMEEFDWSFRPISQDSTEGGGSSDEEDDDSCLRLPVIGGLGWAVKFAPSFQDAEWAPGDDTPDDTVIPATNYFGRKGSVLRTPRIFANIFCKFLGAEMFQPFSDANVTITQQMGSPRIFDEEEEQTEVDDTYNGLVGGEVLLLIYVDTGIDSTFDVETFGEVFPELPESQWGNGNTDDGWDPVAGFDPNCQDGNGDDAVPGQLVFNPDNIDVDQYTGLNSVCARFRLILTGLDSSGCNEGILDGVCCPIDVGSAFEDMASYLGEQGFDCQFLGLFPQPSLTIGSDDPVIIAINNAAADFFNVTLDD